MKATQNSNSIYEIITQDINDLFGNKLFANLYKWQIDHLLGDLDIMPLRNCLIQMKRDNYELSTNIN